MIERKIPLTILRRVNDWIKVVPELHGYPYFTLNTERRVWITRKNIKNNGYQELLKALG